MPRPTKDEKKLARLERREARMKASGEITATKFRVGLGFGGTYLLTQVVLPLASTTVQQNQATLDGATAVIGGAVAFLNDGPIGDVALGSFLVGSIQSLDNAGEKITEWWNKNNAPTNGG